MGTVREYEQLYCGTGESKNKRHDESNNRIFAFIVRQDSSSAVAQCVAVPDDREGERIFKFGLHSHHWRR